MTQQATKAPRKARKAARPIKKARKVARAMKKNGTTPAPTNRIARHLPSANGNGHASTLNGNGNGHALPNGQSAAPTNGSGNGSFTGDVLPTPARRRASRTNSGTSGRMTRNDFRLILADIDCPGWNFFLGSIGKGLYLQVRSAIERGGRIQHGRKWLLSPHMTRSEFVQTALKAVLTAEEHEARERFTYRGAACYAPHLSVDALRLVADQRDQRDEEGYRAA